MIIYDQLHQFATREDAEAAFGTGRDEETGQQAAAWDHDGLTVLPLALHLAAPELDDTDPETGAPVRGALPAEGYWIGLASVAPGPIAAAQALPSARVTMTRPDVPTPWRQCITWAHVIVIDGRPVVSCTTLAGSAYVFD